MANPPLIPRPPIATSGASTSSSLFRAAREAASVATVPHEIESAITHEDVDVFVRALATLKPSTKSDDASFLRLLESALHALGSSSQILGPAVKDLFAVASGSSVRLSTTSNARQSPLLRAMNDGMLLTGVLRHELARYHLEQDVLSQQLGLAKKAAAPLDALHTIESARDLATAPDYVVAALSDAYVDAGAFLDAARVFEHAHADLRASPRAQAQYAKLLLLALPAGDAKARLERTVPGGVASLSPDVRGSYRLELALSQSTSTSTTKAHAQNGAARKQLLADAVRDLTTAVHDAPGSVWPAIDLMRAHLAGGATKRARAAAELVAENALHLHAWKQADVADLRAGAAALAVLGRVDEARALAAAAGMKAAPFEAERAQRALDEAMLGLSSSATGTGTGSSGGANVDDVLLAKTYGYVAGKSRTYAGNYRFGGIAHDERFSPDNVKFFARLLEQNGLAKIGDALIVNAKLDELIRAHNHTLDMENMASATHKTFDDTVQGLKDVMPGSKRNCVTDVAADWLLQLSDCRQHAAMKCAMFETWKSTQRDSHLRDFVGAREKGDDKGAQKALAAVKKLDDVALRILEIVVVAEGSNKPLEEHTANVLVQRDKSGTTARLADSFYQNVYNLGSGVVDVAPKDAGFTLSAKGLARDDGERIRLDSTAYAGDRSRVSEGTDQLSFRGRQLGDESWAKTTSLAGVDFGALTWLANPNKLTEKMIALGKTLIDSTSFSGHVEALVRDVPEMLWLQGNVRTTPEAFVSNVNDAQHADAGAVEVWLKGPQFANNAVGNVLLRALVNGDHDAFTRCQPANVRLTKESFAKLAHGVRDGLTKIGAAANASLDESDALALGFAALTFFATFKDLPKLEDVKKTLESSLGGDVAASPESLLHKVLGRQLAFLTDPASFSEEKQRQAMSALIAAPTFETLTLQTRKMIVGAFGADFNLGQLLQLLEFPAVKLADIAQLSPTERELIDIEGLVDIAGVKGSSVRDGSVTITEGYYQRYAAARNATQAVTNGAAPVDAMNELFRTLTPGLELDPKKPEDFAIGKIAVALSATTPEFCRVLREQLSSWPKRERDALIGELAESGLSRKAIVPRNLPALMRNLAGSDGSDANKAQAAAAALRVCLPLLREMRAYLDDQHAGPGTFQIDLLGLAGAAAKDRAAVLEGVKHSWDLGSDGATLRLG